MNLELYALNESIALLRGWKQNLDGPDLWDAPEGYTWEGIGIPSWSTDKDLMLEEKYKLLEDGHLRVFEKALEFIVIRDSERFSCPPNALHMASARQEAEALALTLEGLKP